MDLAARLTRASAPARTAAQQPRRPAAPAAPAPAAATVAAPAPAKQAREQSDGYYELKTRIHDRLLDLLDLSMLDKVPEVEVRAEIARLGERILREDFAQSPLNSSERLALIAEIQDEVLGLGPLEPFLKDDTVNDILVNSYLHIYVERHGKLECTGARFKDEGHLRRIIDRIVSRVGRRIDESSPMVDARLMDGSRVNAIIPPLAIDGASVSIRKFSRDPLELDDLVRFGAVIPLIGDVLKGIVRARLNILISGGTGSGKTTLLNVLSRFIPSDERIVTIEDAAELQLKQDHVVRLETRPQNIEGRGEVTQRDLVKNCLRMRPDRIIIGEVRGAEALDMLQAMNTGHDGSLTTIHANTPRDALMRLETMVSMAGMNLPATAMRRFISSAIDVIIQGQRLADGSRKVVSFQEVTGMEGEMITMQEIFRFEQTGIDGKGKVEGYFRTMGVRPRFAERLEAMGVKLAENIFAPSEWRP
ncbi:type II secretion system protein E [Desulfovibrio sp. X2]|uniref:CpaF family protein n=1 Tax=Desulfovibrio sp. X2 TaxID=941449 RepID=UPI00035893B1|nr:CpaF family protein [Desulfovibrio sp. X2]EPR44145.1 type II secretion system protein E [Desulfovibrio sp. X2]